MTKIILFLILVTSLSAEKLTLTQEEVEYLKKTKSIKYIAAPKWLPYEAFNAKGEHIGILSEMLKLLEKKLDFHFDIIKTESWTQTLKLANSLHNNIIASDPDDISLQKNFNHTKRSIANSIVIVMQKGNSYVPYLNKIAKKRIAVVKNYGYVGRLHKAYPDINFFDVSSIEDGLIKVSEGEYDAVLASIASASYYMSKNSLSNLSIVGPTKVNMQVSLFVNKENTILLDILDKAIEQLSEEEISQIMRSWSMEDYVTKVDYTLAMQITAIAIILLIISFSWNYNIKKAKEKINKLNKELEIKMNELETLSITDALTKLHNRRHFDKIFLNELNRAKRHKYNLVFAMFDVDFFKKYNDTYGHQKGDTALKEIAKIMQQRTQRAHEFAFRIGGEEFSIITSRLDKKDAYNYINELKDDIENINIIHKENEASKFITASFGLIVIECHGNKYFDTESIYHFADEALYKAKEAGRNTVEIVIK